MKKTICLLGVLLLASGWLWSKSAELDNYNQIQWPHEPAVSAVGAGFALRPILEGKTLVVSLSIEDEQEDNREVFTSLIKDSYQAWFNNVAAQIKGQGREAEFPQILKYVDRQIPISVIAQGPADVAVHVWKNDASLREHCLHRESAAACYHDGQLEFMKTLTMEKQRITFIHEIGHSLGLADQYHIGMQNASPLYSSYQIHDEIMKESNKLSCADADGLVNLIDRTLQLQRPNGARWNSFCPDSIETFKNGISSHANRYLFDRRDFRVLIQEYEKSEKISEKIFPTTRQIVDPFYIPNDTTVLKQDGAGRAALLRSEAGEEIYRVYGQDKEYTEQVVVKENEVLSVQKSRSMQRTKYEEEHKFLFKTFGLGNREGKLACEFGVNMRFAKYEEYKYGEKKPYFTVEVRFDRGNRNKTKNIVSKGNMEDSVLFKQFQGSAEPNSIEGRDQFQKKQSAWVTRFVTFAENWPKYLGLLPEEENLN
ncbi:MAG: hypothetical protein IKN49_06995 [Elusimicrobiaceae bacterium]|nr:hypothetical protein [Elusimicrobiaceae bacterium]